jgi:hypothetical protein
MHYKNKVRREKRERGWIMDSLNKKVKLFLAEYQNELEDILKSKTKVSMFLENYHMFRMNIDHYNTIWNQESKNIGRNNKKSVIPTLNLFQRRMDYLMISFILVDACGMDKTRLVKYFPDGLFEKDEDLLIMFDTLLCEELRKKEKSKINYTELPKRNYFLKIYDQVSYSVSLAVKKLFSPKN